MTGIRRKLRLSIGAGPASRKDQPAHVRTRHLQGRLSLDGYTLSGTETLRANRRRVFRHDFVHTLV